MICLWRGRFQHRHTESLSEIQMQSPLTYRAMSALARAHSALLSNFFRGGAQRERERARLPGSVRRHLSNLGRRANRAAFSSPRSRSRITCPARDQVCPKLADSWRGHFTDRGGPIFDANFQLRTALAFLSVVLKVPPRAPNASSSWYT